MPYRFRVVAIAALTLVGSVLSTVPVGAVAAPQKVVIIVGPLGTGTNNYRQQADETAAAAQAAGATVVKVYSPNATWAKVKAAVAGANIVIYMGHGNGYPSPYSSTENRDRVNGWGLNRVAGAGDGDNWSTTMVYCGEKAILGTLTSSDGAAQWSYCGGSTNSDGISPAPNWVMIYGNACYAPGASESWDVKATEPVAFEHVRNYSYPALAAGASAYYASDIGTKWLVDEILRNPSLTWTDITRSGDGYDEAAQRHFAHPDRANAQIWLQRTARGGSLDYWYAFAGNPLATPAGGVGTPLPGAPADTLPPKLASRSPAASATGVGMSAAVTVKFSEPVTGVASGNMLLRNAATLATIAATVSYDPATLTAVLRPSAPLAPGTSYKMAMSGSIKDAAGNPLAYVAWTFKTAASEAYSPARTLNFAAGTYTGYKFGSTGAVLAKKAYTLSRASGAPTTKRASVPGQSGGWYYVSSGVWAGYWIREGTGIKLG